MSGALNEASREFGRDILGVAALVLTVLLILALGDWPYGYYQFLRLATFGFSCALVYETYRAKRLGWLLLGVAALILFNPIAPIEMDRSDWVLPDLFFALAFGIFGVKASFTNQEIMTWVKRAIYVVVFIVVFVLVGWGIHTWVNSNDEQSYDSNSLAFDTPTTLSPSDLLLASFEAATGQSAAYTDYTGDGVVTTSPLEIVELPFGRALITKSEIADGCHACSGYLGIHYFKVDGPNVTVTQSWPKAVEGWGWGHAPEWVLTEKFTSFPAIYASGSYMGQGITMSSASLTELSPLGPTVSELIGTGFDDGGRWDDGSQCAVSGTIANIVRDQSFDVVVEGSVRSIDRYVKSAGGFKSTSKIDWDSPCG